MNDDHHYPALLLDSLTPVYDLFAKLFLPEAQFKRDLLIQAHLAPGHRVLDLGVGTGTLAIMLKQLQASAQVIGIDGDLSILTIAQQKALRASTHILLNQGDTAILPYADESFDRVVSTLVFSLLSRKDKQRTLVEAHRVLQRGGACLIGDFGPPHTFWGRLLAQRMRRFAPIAENLDGLIPMMFQQANFENVEEVARYATILGTLSIVCGRKSR